MPAPFRQVFSRGISGYAARGAAAKQSGRFLNSIVLTILLAALVMVSSCTPNRRIIESSRTPEPEPQTSASPQGSSFETDLQAMRNADFKFILVFRRGDGKVMDAEDKSFINANTPPDVNRRRISDDGKAVIIGTNFPFLPGMIANLTSRFVMEDHSKPDAGPLEIDRTANSNTAANANRGGQNNSRRGTNVGGAPPRADQ